MALSTSDLPHPLSPKPLSQIVLFPSDPNFDLTNGVNHSTKDATISRSYSPSHGDDFDVGLLLASVLWI